MGITKIRKDLVAFAEYNLYQLIVPFWFERMVDEENGGYHAEIDSLGKVHDEEERGVVTSARILWTASAIYNFNKEKRYLEYAERAFDYLVEVFYDKENLGFFWSVDKRGNVISGEKKIYGQAFVLYSISEYFKVSKNEEAKRLAKELYGVMEGRAEDKENGGYIEAFTKTWGETTELNLYSEGISAAKSLNTHLHILEAYTNYYKVFGEADSRRAIKELLNLFRKYFILPGDSYHLNLFFDNDWRAINQEISYGHEVEAAWILVEAASSVGDNVLLEDIVKSSIKIREASFEAISKNGGLLHEGKIGEGPISLETEWWDQSEFIVSFIDMWGLTGEDQFLELAYNNCQFIKKHFINKELGEWYFRLDPKNKPILRYELAGFWKCPYHTARMSLEILKRLA